MLDEFVHQPRIAYFSMEIALQDEVPTYSGGLGVLAGDTLRSAVDLGLPVVGVSLVSRAGYFRQEIDASGRQVERPDVWEPRNWAEPTEAKIAVLIEGREVWVRSWLYVVQGHLGGRQPVILLDTDLDENQSDDRKLTHYLYGGDETYRIKQEMVLGIGGVRMLNALGFRVRQYHMNEGHSAFLALELLKRFARLYDTHLPGWCHEPELLVRIDQVTDEAVWAAHMEAKRRLIQHVEAFSRSRFSPELPIVGFARRMTAYKRPDLLFSDLERLKAIARKYPFQIVMAGKAHPRDEGGRQLIERLHGYRKALDDIVPMVFFPNYGMERALDMVSGVDVWLNTPLRPLEASGTSGMKAAFNGVPQLSVLDGWWLEGCIEGITGWAIGSASDSSNHDDAASLYDKLEHKVLPLYAGDRRGWIAVMKGAIGKNASYFNSHRMMRRYATEAYIR